MRLSLCGTPEGPTATRPCDPLPCFLFQKERPMKIVLIEENNEVTTFGGVVITPRSITHEDMPRLNAEYEAECQEAGSYTGQFIDWLIRKHGCTEEKEVCFAFVGCNNLPKTPVAKPVKAKAKAKAR